MSETSCVNATVAVVGNPTSNKGKGAEVGKQVVELLQEAGRKHGFNVIDVTVADGNSGEFTVNLRNQLLGIQLGEIEDPHNWMWKVC